MSCLSGDAWAVETWRDLHRSMQRSPTSTNGPRKWTTQWIAQTGMKVVRRQEGQPRHGDDNARRLTSPVNARACSRLRISSRPGTAGQLRNWRGRSGMATRLSSAVEVSFGDPYRQPYRGPTGLEYFSEPARRPAWLSAGEQRTPSRRQQRRGLCTENPHWSVFP